MFSHKDETPPLSIAALEDYPSIRIVRLRGPINQQAVSELERFRKWAAKQRGFHNKHVLLDFKNVTQIDTSAVAEMIQEASELKSDHYCLGAINLPEAVRGLFQVLRVENLIAVYENESKALEDMTGKAP
jgi:ABC-type transporter Mla MlaB component